MGPRILSQEGCRYDMITLQSAGVRWQKGTPVPASVASPADREKTMAYQIFRRHNQREEAGQLHLKFDSLISHDITYVGIIQTAKASGLKEFPVPYVMTNCHNSLCAVGGTINEDDHVFGLSAAIKYGGNFVPANQAVIHQYAREMMSGCGRMILGSDSHTRYGAIGTMGVGEGGPEIVKQLLKNTYDIASPQVVLVYLTGSPAQGVGPHDVAIALCGAVYKNGFVKNKVLEFAGPGIAGLPMDYRIGIDVMTTETACLSSIWETDGAVEEYLAIHGRPEAYEALHPQEGAYYDRPTPATSSGRWKSGPPSSSGARSTSPSPTSWWTARSWWTRGSSPAVPGGCTTTSLRPPPFWTATTWAAATSPCPSIPPPCR